MVEHRFGSRIKSAFGVVFVTFIGSACHDIASPEQQRQSAGAERVVKVASANSQTTKEFRLRGGRKLVIDHGRGLLIGDEKAVKIPDEALKKIESTLTQFAELDRFFEELDANEQYKACLKAGKNSNKKIVIARATPLSFGSSLTSLGIAPVAQPLLGSADPLGLEPTSGDRWQPVDRRSMVVEPGSCGEWANTLSQLSASLVAMENNYINRIGDALIAGAVFSNLSFWTAGWETTVAGIAAGLLQELVGIWNDLAALTIEIDVVRSMLVIGDCVTQLPPMTIYYNGGSGGSSGDKCTFLVISYMESYDGGQTWHLVSQRYEYRCAP